VLQQFPIHIPFPNNYWDVLIFHPLSSQIKGGFMLSQYVIVLGQEYWETAKATPSIILKLLLRHLPIPVIEKGLLENCWRCCKYKHLEIQIWPGPGGRNEGAGASNPQGIRGRRKRTSRARGGICNHVGAAR